MPSQFYQRSAIWTSLSHSFFICKVAMTIIKASSKHSHKDFVRKTEGGGCSTWFLLHSCGLLFWLAWGLLSGTVVKNLPADTRDEGFIPGLGRFPGEGKGYPLQYSCLKNPLDSGVRQATVHGVAESNVIEHRHTHTHILTGLSQRAGCLKLDAF